MGELGFDESVVDNLPFWLMEISEIYALRIRNSRLANN
jgi:hypothetical protein